MDDAAKYEISRLHMELRRRDAILEMLRNEVRRASSDVRDADDRIVYIACDIIRHGYDQESLRKLKEAVGARDAAMLAVRSVEAA